MPYFLHLWVKICSKTDYKLQVRLLKVSVQDLKKEKRKAIYGSGHRKIYNWGWTGKNNKTHNYFKQLYYT